MDSDTGKVVARVRSLGDVDDLYVDSKRRRIFISSGDGAIAVIRQDAADHYAAPATIPALPGARASLFDAETGRLFLSGPTSGGLAKAENPKVWAYQARP